MIKLTRFEKLVIASLMILALAIACEQKNTQSVEEAKVPTATGSAIDAEAGNYTSPEPIGGFEAIQKNVKFPESARKAGIEGRVYVKLKLTKTGDVTETTVTKIIGEGHGFEEAALDAVKGVKWTPAFMDGQPVECTTTIPITFALGKKGLLSGENFPTQTDGSGKIFEKYDVPPEPIGGFKAIQKNLKYPESARKEGIEGHVFVNVAIDENGDAFKTEICESLSKDCDTAALEAIQKTKWKPAERSGKPVKVWIRIPIIFKLR